jgi:MHS family alpha-ketoglutarate permease-like MFS transporter
MTTHHDDAARDRDTSAPAGGDFTTDSTTHTRPAWRTIAAVNLGNVLEWFDWTIFATFPIYFSGHFFAGGDSVASLLSTLAVFAAGFLVRPLGGLVFGRIADRRGRRFGLVLTMSLVALSSLLVAVGPTYETIGVGAAFYLLFARCLQGFAHGGELGGAYTYLAEVASPRNRGFWGSTIVMSTVGGALVATLLAALMRSVLTREELVSWAWRIPFLVGALLGLLALYLRRSLAETETFDRSKGKASAPAPDARVAPTVSYPLALFRVMMIVAATTLFNYVWSVSAPAYAITFHGVNDQGALWAGVVANAIGIVAIGFAGRLSDRWGRRRNVLLWAVGVIVLSFPLNAVLGPSSLTLLLAMTVALVLNAFGGSVQVAWFAELFSTERRATGVGLAVSVSAALFGGTAAYLNSWLSSIGLAHVFIVYSMVLAALCGISAWFTPETKGTVLR